MAKHLGQAPAKNPAAYEEHLLLRKVVNCEIVQISFVYFVYGNTGWDVIADYGCSIEATVDPISEWAGNLEK